MDINGLLKRITTALQYVKWSTVILIGALFVIYLEPHVASYLNRTQKESVSYGQLGDYIGGVWGTFISAVTFFLILLTYINQRIELKETQKQLRKQQFETVFFNMLGMIHTLGKELKESGKKDFFVELIDEMKADYIHPDSITPVRRASNVRIMFDIDREYNNEVISNPRKLAPTKSKTELFNEWRKKDIMNEEKYMGLLYRHYFLESNSQLGHFFRYIYNTVKFVIEERQLDCNDEAKYINLIQSQLSNYQLTVMFYNCISPVSFNSKGIAKFKGMLDEYEVFQNTQPSILINRTHQRFFPQTKFKHRF
jgi:hypothetical protein